MTARTVVVCGYGPGISQAVARKLGAEGFQVGLVARSRDKVEAGARALAEEGVTAKGFACDLGDPAAVRALVADVRSSLGPVTVIHWNAYAGLAGDLLTCDVDDLRKVFDVGVSGLVVAVQESLGDMEAQERPAVLVTGGGFALYDENVDRMTVEWKAMGLALSKSAQHKLVRLLHHALSERGVYVGEVMVLGTVKGTAFDQGQATLEPAAIAERFWEIYQARSDVSVMVR